MSAADIGLSCPVQSLPSFLSMQCYQIFANSERSVISRKMFEKCIIIQWLNLFLHNIMNYQTLCLCYLPQPLTLADNLDLHIDNLWCRVQPHSIIPYYYMYMYLLNCIPQLHRSTEVCLIDIVAVFLLKMQTPEKKTDNKELGTFFL